MPVLSQLYIELGLKALAASPRDVKLLILQRFVRLIAYGSSTLVLTLFLIGLGHDEEKTGLFMTLTLWGDVVISLVLTLVADKVGRRQILALGALLMAASGIVFATCSQYWILVLASIIGVTSPSGNETGPFKAIEESTLSQLISLDDRSSILAWYTMSGAAGAAIGVVVFGWVVNFVQNKYLWTAVESYRIIFWGYALLGIFKCLLCFMLSKHCELGGNDQEIITTTGEQAPLLNQDHHPDAALRGNSAASSTAENHKTWLPKLSRHTVFLLIKLCAIFAFDSLGSGIASMAWLVYFFNLKFNLQEGQLGTLFFVTNLVSSASSLVSASLAKRIGLIKTMVFTHLPASVLLAVLPIPSNKAIAVAFLVGRSSITSMDQAPRQAFLAAAVLPEERTTVMGVVNVLKTFSQSLGPLVTGNLASFGKVGLAFIIAGILKCTYDFLLLGLFLGYRTVEEKTAMNLHEDIHQAEDETIISSPEVPRS